VENEEVIFVKGVPNREASKYVNEYLKLAYSTMEILEMIDADAAKKFLDGISTSGYVKRRHDLQTKYDSAVMHEDIEGAGRAASEISELRTLNYMMDESIRPGMDDLRLHWNLPGYCSPANCSVPKEGGAALPGDYTSLSSTQDYAFRSGLN
jgi:hypothetical protein